VSCKPQFDFILSLSLSLSPSLPFKGQSDEYSFVIRRLSYLFNRRSNKVTSLITSAFTSAFVYYWSNYFDDNKNASRLTFHRYNEYIPNGSPSTPLAATATNLLPSMPLKYPPSFDGRAVIYPNERTLTDYLRWRQVDCHVNNLYNTAFYALTGEYTRYVEKSNGWDVFLGFNNDFEGPNATNPPQTTDKTFYNHQEATQKLSGSSSGDKNEILFTDYGVNYNNELEQFRKGEVSEILCYVN